MQSKKEGAAWGTRGPGCCRGVQATVQIPGAAIKKDHELGGSQQRNLILLPASETKMSVGCAPPAGLEDYPFLVWLLLGALGVRGSCLTPVPASSPCVCLLFLIKTLVMGVRAHLGNSG